MNKEDIDIREDPHTIFGLVRKYGQGRLIINPEFQRNLVWNIEQKSKFIESVILNFPLPPFYLNQIENGNLVVVDGLQRIATLLEFTKKEFQLKGLETLPKLNGKNFSQLTQDYQTRIEDKKLMIYVIKPSVSIEVVYDIFNRINTGGTPLNRQEVRNCIFIGQATELLKELSEKECFKKAIDFGVAPKRMKDREVILRCLAFNTFNYETDYDEDMSVFIEKTMRKINLMTESEIEQLKTDFERAMNSTFDFFGKNNFRLPVNQTRGRINTAVLESVCYFFFQKNDGFLEKNKKIIQSNFNRLIQDETYLNAVQFSTGSKAKVKARFERAQEILGKNLL